jgi:hypothetical protein
MHLKRAYARWCPDRRSNLGREVGKGRNVVSDETAGARELVASQLHAIAGVSSEADDNVIKGFDGYCHEMFSPQ